MSLPVYTTDERFLKASIRCFSTIRVCKTPYNVIACLS